MRKKDKRYIYDPLYGLIYLPNFIWDVISCPELQRLREVRLCNINSLCLTGGANINRYEHSIGTCYLALRCINSWPPLNLISEKELRLFVLAALLHDVINAAFGHSVEYIESKEGFDPEKAFEYVSIGEKGQSYQYKQATFEPIFFGMLRELSSKIPEEDLRAIGNTIAGSGRFGALINGVIDLDNIDNVFRLAYHIGLVRSGEVPLKLASSLWTENGKLVVGKEVIPLVEQWHEVRKKLYSLLLLNPEEFSAKCMLSEAIELAKMKDVQPFSWYYVDYQLLEELSKKSSETSMIISRLMKGDLYGCIGIFLTRKIVAYEIFSNTERRKRLEDELSEIIRSKFVPHFKSAMIALHSIIDVNKTERQVLVQTNEGQVVQIGDSSNRLLIGAFFKNADLGIQKVNSTRSEVMRKISGEVSVYLSSVLGDQDLREIELYGEIKELG
jgi:HD superfamily phosphohydrolase